MPVSSSSSYLIRHIDDTIYKLDKRCIGKSAFQHAADSKPIDNSGMQNTLQMQMPNNRFTEYPKIISTFVIRSSILQVNLFQSFKSSLTLIL